MRMTRTWDSTMSMIPKGGDTIWGGLDWSADVSYNCSAKKHKNNDTYSAFQNGKENLGFMKNINYGRLISFGKDIADLHSSKLERLDFRVMFLIYTLSILFIISILLFNVGTIAFVDIPDLSF